MAVDVSVMLGFTRHRFYFELGGGGAKNFAPLRLVYPSIKFLTLRFRPNSVVSVVLR